MKLAFTILKKTLLTMVSIGMLLFGIFLHELGHLFYILSNGYSGVLAFGYVPSLGFETFYILGDFSGINTILLCISGGIFAGFMILCIGLKYKWLLWVGFYHLFIGLFEYVGIGSFERCLLDGIFIFGIITGVLFMKGVDLDEK